MWLFGVGLGCSLPACPGGRGRQEPGVVVGTGRRERDGGVPAGAGQCGGRLVHRAGRSSVTAPWHVPFGRFSSGAGSVVGGVRAADRLVVAVAAVYGMQYLHGPHAPVSRRPRRGSSSICWRPRCCWSWRPATAVLFLMCWEGMSLASFFLVMTDHEQERVRRAAGSTWWPCTWARPACWSCSCCWAERSGSAWTSISSRPNRRWPGVLFVLAVVGFGTKAGFIPRARVAARGASGRPVARVGGDERRDDQDGDLRAAAHADVSGRAAAVVGLDAGGDRRGVGRLGRACSRWPSTT